MKVGLSFCRSYVPYRRPGRLPIKPADGVMTFIYALSRFPLINSSIMRQTKI